MISQHIDALLFDMDGVLVDSVTVWWRALNEALINAHYNSITKEEFIQHYWGHDLHDTLSMIKVNSKIIPHCNALYETYVDQVALFPNVINVLTSLHSYPKAIITNTPRFLTEKVIRNLMLESFFDVIVTGDDVGKGKPYPDIIYNACDQLQLHPSNTVLIGDTQSDIAAGRAAHCIVIGVNIEGDYTISSLIELMHLIPV